MRGPQGTLYGKNASGGVIHIITREPSAEWGGTVSGTAIEEETAINIKNEALRSLKDRLLTRAEIIQRRLEEEQKNLENAYMELRRKGDNINSQDEQ